MEDFARSLAAAVGVTGATSASNPIESKWFNALVKDLQAHEGSSLVVAGDNQSPEVHALAHAINATLGNAGKTVIYTDPIEVNPTDQFADFKSLMADLDAGSVDILLIIGVNPVYDAPADLDFANKYQKARPARTLRHLIRTRPRSIASGTFRCRTRLKCGAMRALMMAPSPSSSRSSRRCIRAGRHTKFLPRSIRR